MKTGDTVELPHHLAILATGQLVDQIMMEEARQDELEHAATPYYRSPKGIKVGVPEARKPYEDAILKELEVDENSSQFQVLKSKALDDIKKDFEAEPAKPISKISAGEGEFASIKNK